MQENYQITHRFNRLIVAGRRVTFILLVGFCCLISACGTPSSDVGSQKLEFKNPGPWLNSEPFTLSEKMGEVVLVDFWTYTCINCLRTLPYLKDWHEKYSEYGLTIVGVHSPEFDFEKIPENVATAVAELEIAYPVFQDNNRETWREFNNRYWPAKYLVDHRGIIKYEHFGEGGYAQTEHAIRNELEQAGFDISNIPTYSAFVNEEAEGLPLNRKQTRELYAGTDRNYTAYRNYMRYGRQLPYIGNEEYFSSAFAASAKEEVNFTDPGLYEVDQFYINGLWRKKAEHLLHARTTMSHTDYLVLKFSGSEVNIVLEEGKEPYDVRVEIDDIPLKENEAGIHIKFDQDGNSYIEVTESKMFNIVKLSSSETRFLKLSSLSSDFSVYAFTFGSRPRNE
jgi:thiol-disulfide isomerase/thioredoxin